MAYGVKLKVWGPYACFTRPEMKVERVSYDIMTPSAARGILEAVYWKPEIRWNVRRIHVLNPIKFDNIRRNELGNVLSALNIKKAMKDGKTELSVFIEDDRQQRAALVLKDVSYIIEADFEILSGDNNPLKHKEMFERRARKGQCFNTPCLGCREFSAAFELVEDEVPASELKGEKDYGWMLHDIDFENGMEPKFFRAKAVDGIIDVPSFRSDEVRA